MYGRGGGLEAYTLLSRLWQAGFDGVHGVPQPLGYEPERSLLLQSEAPPSTLHDGLADPARSVADVRRVGGWLAALHAAGDLGLPRLDPTFEPTKVASYVGALTAARPDLARLNDVADALLVELATTDAPLVATHGDFQPKNVHLDAERVVVIDFDRASLAPAARDLGHFVGQALTMAAARSGQFATVARDWASALLDGYVEAGGSAAAVEQTPPYVARTILEVLFYRLIVRPGPDTSFASAWLAECACWLGSRHSCLA